VTPEKGSLAGRRLGQKYFSYVNLYVALEGDVGALREAIHQLVGRPPEVVQGDPDRPIRVVVESISARRREQLADVEAGAPKLTPCGKGGNMVVQSVTRRTDGVDEGNGGTVLPCM
jgi:hypothetical protein